MFDYDARPVTPQVVVVGLRASSVGYQLRDFLSRNGVPYEWVEIDDTERVRNVLDADDIGPDRLPICVLPDGSQLAAATVEGVATGLGLVSPPSLAEYDLTIVGAGPAGLAAAVYAASEGLRTVAIEAVAPGGQAGTTSMIENYLGFPQGISGSELATRATAQARRFGAEVLLARPLVDISDDGPGYVARLSDGTEVRSRSMLVASGVDWRRLDVPGLDDLLGAGVYYGAGPSEAVSCRGCRVAVVGGGNSAGQAVVRFSRYASRVTLLVRGRALGDSMSQYLATRSQPTRERRHPDRHGGDRTRGGHATPRRRRSRRQATPHPSACRWSRSSSASAASREPRDSPSLGLAIDEAGYLRTGADVQAEPGAQDRWPLSRPPLPLETNRPGLFAAGDVRSGSIKRCSAAIGEGSMAVALVHRRLAEVGGE